MYKLSGYIKLSKEKKKNKEIHYYVIMTRKSVRHFLINQFIFDFLAAFKKPTTFDKVLNEYMSKITKKDDLKELEAQLRAFYDDMRKRNWIVTEDTVVIESNVETLFNKNDEFLHYKVKKVLANNKRTDVYLVLDKLTNKQVVIKLLNRLKVSSDKRYHKYLNEFEIEYNFLTKFNSIYINKALDFSFYNEQALIVLKYERGKSVNRFVDDHFLNSKDKAKLVLKILKAFSLVHDAGVFHGDIHFSNIMVNRNKQPRIIDFGYSNAVEEVKNESKNVRNGGVYSFIPPERAIRSLDRRFSAVQQFQSEVYQISLVLYYIYMKKLPFKAITWKTMVDEKQAFNIETYHPFLKRRMPVLIRNFIIKGLQKEPENRFETAQDMHSNWKKIIDKLS
jgi:serine/threonine-protein kinase